MALPKPKKYFSDLFILPRSSRKLRGIEEVDHNKLKNIEKILLDAVAEMQRSHTLPHQGHQISTGMSATPPKTNTRDDIIRVQNQNEASTKRGRRQNHKNEQKNVLMAWFAQHELDPYPNNDEKFALARASGLEVRQVEHCERLASHHWHMLHKPWVPARTLLMILLAGSSQGSQTDGSDIGVPKQISLPNNVPWQNKRSPSVACHTLPSRALYFQSLKFRWYTTHLFKG
eukprot:scaffold114064_cov30-Tisochrysis_lutea.AAC.1